MVDLDLASFFDEVDHNLLIARVRHRVKDVRAIQLIRSCLNAGVMLGGLVQSTDKGTPHDGSLSPLLSNILPDASTGNWRSAATPSTVTPTTATYTLRAGAAANG